MAYTALTSVTNIQPYFNNEVFDGNSIPSNIQIDVWISEVTSIIYGAIAHMYVIPVTNADDLLILQSLCNTYIIEEINFAKSRGTYSTSKSKTRVPKQKRHDDFFIGLGKLLNGTTVLLNTTRASNKIAIYSYNNANSIISNSTKEDVQW